MRFLKRPWELGENEVTPEALFVDRRKLLGGAAGALAAGLVGLPKMASAAVPAIEKLLPAKVPASRDDLRTRALALAIVAAAVALAAWVGAQGG